MSVSGAGSYAPPVEAPALEVHAEPLVRATPAPRSIATALRLQEWNWSLPTSGTGLATLTARVANDSFGGHSGSLGLSLWLSSAPFGAGGVSYPVINSTGAESLAGGWSAEYTATSTFALASVPDGTYYVLAVVSEFDGFVYSTVAGDTSTSTYSITTSAPQPAPAPVWDDTTAPTATLKGKSLVTSGRNYKFTITYFDAGGLELNDVDTDDITWTDPWGEEFPAQMVKVKSSRFGTKCAVTYQIDAPAGRWFSDDNGTYQISLVDGEVADQSGNEIEGGYWTFIVQARKANPFAVSTVIQFAMDGAERTAPRVSDDVLHEGALMAA